MNKKFKNRKSQKGFTLVELSIILVIIGLIISSVLVGQDLVRSAELRALVTQYESFNAAIGTFRGKYGGMPGDVRGAADFGFIGDGDGNGLIGDTLAVTDRHDPGENVYFWNHLGSSGAALISGSYAGVAITNAATTTGGVPKSKIGDFWGTFSTGGTNYFVVGVASTPAATGNQTTNDLLNSIDARSVDEKIDDARPYRGVVQAREGHASEANTDPSYDQGKNAEACTGGTAASVDATAEYNTAFSAVDCTLRIRFNL